MRVLVTGNLGYLGVAITEHLAAAGHTVVGLDVDYFANGHFGAQPITPCAHQFTVDLRDAAPAALEGIDAVIHLAALSNDPMGDLDPSLTDDINHRAAVRLARLARAAGATRFLFSSSCSIYGQNDDQALTETSAFNPLTAYARSKVAAETGLAALATDDFSPVFLRNGTVYGLSAKLRLDLVANNLTAWAFTTGQVRLMSDGQAWRPLVHVEDVARAFIAALEAPRAAVHNQAFNVGCDDDNYQVRTIAECVRSVVPDCQVTFGDNTADNRTYRVSFAKIHRELPSFRPAWSLERGVRQLYDALQTEGLSQADFEGPKYTRLKQLRHLVDTHQVAADLRFRPEAVAQ